MPPKFLSVILRSIQAWKQRIQFFEDTYVDVDHISYPPILSSCQETFEIFNQPKNLSYLRVLSEVSNLQQSLKELRDDPDVDKVFDA